MIYLDNAATTWPKPPTVRAAMVEALNRFGANPGRGGHQMAMETAEKVYACREEAADFFGISDPRRVIFTANCTGALNMVIKGLLLNGGHAVISDMEHNSVVRPLEALARCGVTYTTARVCEANPTQTAENVRRAIRPDTRLILCTHASNVFGTVLPIREIAKIAHRYGIPFAVDAAQSAGILPIDMEKDGIDYLCVPGHKGLYGPMGTGMLLCRSEEPLYTILEGGTGNRSLERSQPEELPERLESGTLNVPGISGLHAGLLWLRRQGLASVAQYEFAVAQRLYSDFANTPTIRLYSKMPREGEAVPLFSFNIGGRSSEETGTALAENGVAVRAGLHCAPLAHAHAGTLPKGTVRVAPSVFNLLSETEKTHKILLKILRKP